MTLLGRLLLILLFYTLSVTAYVRSPSECGAIHLTVSSLDFWPGKNSDGDNLIELNWDLRQCSGVPESRIPNQIALYKNNPAISNESIPLTTVFVKDHIWGYYITNIAIGEIQIPKKPPSKKRNNNPKNNYKISNAICLPFWIASFRDNELLKSECLKMQPTWMGDIKNDIADMKLTNVILPGTHNAGSYRFQTMLQLFRSNLIERFTLCQNIDIYSQLFFGIRYLDFRISYEILSSESLWLSHGVVRVRPLKPLLRDIRRFLELTTDEIVILDIHQLTAGFYDSNDKIILDRHQYLIETLVQEFSDYIVDYGALMNSVGVTQGPKVSDIWESGGRLIIGYPDGSIRNTYKWLWPRVNHMWADTNDPYELKKYLDNVMNSVSKPNALWSAMAQMTPTTLDVVLSDKSLRKMADEVNRNITTWLQYEWNSKANIIASDFYLGNNVINLAVYYNSLKGKLMKTSLGKFKYQH